MTTTYGVFRTCYRRISQFFCNRPARLILLLFAIAFLGACAKVGPPPGYKGKKDIYPPEITGISIEDSTHLTVRFSEAVEPISAQRVEHYEIFEDKPQGERLVVTDVISGRNGAEVIIVTEPAKSGADYRLSVFDVKDKAGNSIDKRNTRRFKGSGKVDTLEPSLLRTSPATGQRDVPTSICPLLVFNDCIDPESARNAITLLDDAEMPVAGKVVGENHSFHFVPDAPLNSQTVYMLKVSRDLKDLAGNPLYEEAEITFQTIQDVDAIALNGTVVDTTRGKASAPVVRLTDSPRFENPDAAWFSVGSVREDGTFTLSGISPQLPKDASYYIWVSATMPPETDETISAYGCLGDIHKPTALTPPPAGATVEGVTLLLDIRDKRGPDIENLLVTPTLYHTGDGIRVECVARQGGESDSTIRTAEIFVGARSSGGTGLQLSPVAGAYDSGKVLRLAADYPYALRDKGAGEISVFVHAENRDLYWGGVTETRIKPQTELKNPVELAGAITFGNEPVPDAILRLYKVSGGEQSLVLLGRADKKGGFKLGPVSAGDYYLYAYKDEKGNNLDDSTDPCGYWVDENANRLLSATTSRKDLKLELEHRPVITEPMVRLYINGPVEGKPAVAKYYAFARVQDYDFNLKSVELVSESGERMTLNDSGKDGDATADDGLFSLVWQLEGQAIPTTGARMRFAMEARDESGNVERIDSDDFPSLLANAIPLPQGLSVVTTKTGLKVNWLEGETPPPGGWLLFIMPASREPSFDGPGTGELFTNFPTPYRNLHEVELTLDQLGNYWSIPRGSQMLAILMALADDADPAQADKAITKYYFIKP